MLPLPPFSLSLRQRLVPSEPERHEVRTDDEVEMDAEDGHEPQLLQAEALQNPNHVLNCLRGTRTWCETVVRSHLCLSPGNKTECRIEHGCKHHGSAHCGRKNHQTFRSAKICHDLMCCVDLRFDNCSRNLNGLHFLDFSYVVKLPSLFYSRVLSRSGTCRATGSLLRMNL